MVKICQVDDKESGNYWVALGTPIAFIIKTLGSEHAITNNTALDIIEGGPLMGQYIDNWQAPITKKTNCLIINLKKQTDQYRSDQPATHNECIRCGECEKACPMGLLPQQLYWFSQSEEWDKLEAQGLSDCIDCGACAYVCPSDIPLVQYYRYGRSVIQQNQANLAAANKAKARFEFREMRLAREKAERALKQKKTAEARRQASKNPSDDPGGKQTAINEALARVKQKKSRLAEKNQAESKK